jgi:NADH dehydrogenase
VHLVAIIRGRPQDFERVMAEGTRNVIAAAKDAGVGRFVLMSALGTTATTKDVVPYFGAKWAMEQDVTGSGLEYTVMRPSFVFGRGGGVLPTFVKQVRYSPVVTVIGSGRQRIQPIWIDDVAEYFARAVDAPAAANRTFELGGPDVVTWDGLYETIAKVLGKRRRLLHVPASVARAGATATQWVPGAPLTNDQISMIEAGDNVAGNSDAVDVFKLPLVPLEEQIRRAA